VFSRAAVGALVVLLLLGAAGVAAVAPAATVVIQPVSEPIEPVRYTLALPADGVDEGEVSAEAQGTATGVFRDPTTATGVVVFSNWNTTSVRVDAGTRVAAGEVAFATEETIVVPTGAFLFPGTAEAAVVAVESGPAGNLPTDAIDTILDEEVRDALRAFTDNPNRLVENPEPTAGGSDNEQPRITRRDVNRTADALRADLQAQLEGALTDEQGMLYAPVDAAEPEIDIPDDLVGRTGEETFSLAGTLSYRRARIAAENVESAAHERLLDDPGAAPPGRSIVEDSIEVEMRRVTREGDALEARVTVTALADPIVEVQAVRDMIAGLTAAEAEAALAGFGDVEVGLWPGWVDRVPQLDWRIEVQIVPAEASAS
jgi:hypothetical protein